MLRTVVGYTGGVTPDPTYAAMGDHTESLQVEYDPDRISYEDLLEVFWSEHDAVRPTLYVQYRPVVFAHDEHQMELALGSRDRLAASLGAEVKTAILPSSTFYPAEDYHQKYYLRNEKNLMKIFRSRYPEDQGFVRSTVAARVNGYLGGFGTLEQVQAAVETSGFDPAQGRQLIDRASALRAGRSCRILLPGIKADKPASLMETR